MKVIVLLTFFTAFGLTLHAQQDSTPVKDFALKCSATTLEVHPGETGKVDLTIQKSKQFQKGKVSLGTGSSLPKGVSVTCQPDAGVMDAAVVQFMTTAEVVPGTYSIILNGTINQKTKGVIIKLIIL